MKVKAPYQVDIYRRMFARHMRIAWRLVGWKGKFCGILAVIHTEVRG